MTAVALSLDTIPAELRELRQWVIWRKSLRKGQSTKIPYRPTEPRRYASSTDPDTWATFAEAVAAWDGDPYGGIGFVFTDTPFAGVDLDHVRDADTGVVIAEAQRIIDEFATYSEVSQSGTGVHIIFAGEMPGKGRKVAGGVGWEIEAYSTGRYFACTGERVGEVTNVCDRQSQLDDLLGLMAPGEDDSGGNGNTVADIADARRRHVVVAARDDAQRAADPDGYWTAAEIDEALIAQATAAGNGTGEAFAALWRGDWSAHGSHSEGDYALLRRLRFWTGADVARMDSLFRRSGLYRDKWEREDYRDRTIAAVIAEGGDVYTKRHTGNAQAVAAVPDGTPTGTDDARDDEQPVPDGTPAPDSIDAEVTVPRADRWEDRSDSGNAAIFVRLMGDRVRHVGVWDTWLVYDSGRWQRDTRHLAETLMGEALLTRFDEAKPLAAAGDEEGAKQASKWAASSRSTAKIAAALWAARSDQRVTAGPDDFDTDNYVLNCVNGTLDLRTGDLRPHDSRDLVTKMCPVIYDPSARSELWERVLSEATDGDVDLQDTLRRFAGYCLTGDAREESFYILHGPQATMKSTFVAALGAVLGIDYSIAVDPEAFLARSHTGGPRDDVADMEGMRLVVVAEFDRGKQMAEALLKQLAGGDRVRARHLYQGSREFGATFKIAFHTNHVPQMSDDDGAVWRRAWVIPFTHSIPEDKRDPKVKAALTDPAVSGPAILAWAMQGCLEWQAVGLGKPPAVASATAAIRASMDPLGEWLADCCVVEPGVWTSAAVLRSSYQAWYQSMAKGTTVKPVGNQEWSTRLNGRGVVAGKHHHTRGWNGIRLVDADTVDVALDLETTADRP